MKKSRSNQKGQFVIEAVLLMVVMLSIFMASVNALKDGQYLAKLISGPWEKIAGMIESGVWDGAAAARKNHPNQLRRNVTVDPDL